MEDTGDSENVYVVRGGEKIPYSALVKEGGSIPSPWMLLISPRCFTSGSRFVVTRSWETDFPSHGASVTHNNVELNISRLM